MMAFRRPEKSMTKAKRNTWEVMNQSIKMIFRDISIYICNIYIYILDGLINIYLIFTGRYT